jgi:photosystem II stability/assembly factor-like uncharacterized protein
LKTSTAVILFAVVAILSGIVTFVPVPPDSPYTPLAAFEEGVPADEWFERQRAFPFEEIPQAEYLKSMEFARQSPGVSRPSAGPQWQLSGPTNIEGRITSVAIHPTNPRVVYAGCAGGGVWKSTDFCSTWRSLFDQQNTSSIGALAIDPSSPDVIYCGTGEANAIRSYYPGTGIYKSTDGGVTWNPSGLSESFCIGAIAINPQDPRILYVAAMGSLRRKTEQRGIFRSTDAGASWERMLFVADSVGAIDVVLNPLQPNRIIAAMWERQRREDAIKNGGPGSALYRSTDGGGSWSVLTGGFPSGQPTLGRVALDMCNSKPLTVFALAAGSDGINNGLYKSMDGGTSWTLVNANVGSSSNYGWFNRIVRSDPSNEAHLLCGGMMMEVSHDGGVTFPSTLPFHVDQHAVAFAPSDPRYVVVGNDGGIVSSTNGGTNWVTSASLPVTQFYAGEIDPTNPDVLLGGSQDNSTVRTLTGRTDDWETIYGGDGMYCRVDYTNAMRVYVSSQYGYLAYSTDWGKSFFDGTNGLDLTYSNWMTPYVLDKNNPLVIYCGTYRIHRSSDGMASWVPISPDLTRGHVTLMGTITTVDVSRTDPSVIYCGTDDARVWVTTNGGGGWTEISGGLPYRWVTRVTVHADSANVCYVTLSGYKVDSTGAHIFRTTDFGSTWVSIRGNLPDAPINDVILDPADPAHLLIATDIGVMHTTDYGAFWEMLGEGFPTLVPVLDLTLDEATRKLVAWTHGRSAFTLALPLTSGVAQEAAPEPNGIVLEQNYPNPFNAVAVIRYTIAGSRKNGAGSKETKLAVYDLLGREVATLVNERKGPGQYEVTFDGSGLASGVYFYRLAAGAFIESRKMVLMK